MIKRCHSIDNSGWLTLRQALWSHCTTQEHLAEMDTWCSDPDRYAAFVAFAESGEAVGFVEASIRHDYVNGTDSSPVGYLEGLYVAPPFRRRGIARELVLTVEAWVARAGCRELASDTDIGNVVSRQAHRALGFEETEHVVFFRRRLV